MTLRKFFTRKLNVLILALICCFLWGSAYPSIKIGYEIFKILPADIPSKLLFAGYRFTLAGILVLVCFSFMNKTIEFPGKNQLPQFILLGFFQTTLQYIFFYIGLTNTTGVKGAILNSVGIFFSIVFAHFIYKNDRLSVAKIAGCAVGFSGVIIVNFSEDLKHINFNFFGDGFIIIAAIVSSAALIYGKKLSGSVNTVLLTGYQLLIGGLILTLLGVLSGGHLQFFGLNSYMLLLYMGFLSAVAFTLWTTLLKYNSVSSISMYNLLVPVFGTFLSALFLGENILQVRSLIALLLVCAGIYIVNKFS
ncbi:MAG: DMT family transporter [Clostridiaceae bacterium]